MTDYATAKHAATWQLDYHVRNGTFLRTTETIAH